MSTFAIKMQVEVTRHGMSRSHYYKATLGFVSGEGKTEIEARRDLEARMVHLASNITTPTIMWDLIEPQTCWIAYPTQYGWGYVIERQRSADDGTPSRYSSGCSTGGSWTKDECLDRMREHWYANNIAPVVDGIMGLCTDLRQYVCPVCCSASRGHAPYRCQNPVCGRTVTPEDDRRARQR